MKTCWRACVAVAAIAACCAMPLCAQNKLASAARLVLPQTKTDWLNWSLGGVDAAQTVYLLNSGGHENWNPTQSASGNVAMILGAKAVETGIAHKCRRKICRAMPWTAIAGSAAAIGYSSLRGARQCVAMPSSVRATYVCR